MSRLSETRSVVLDLGEQEYTPGQKILYEGTERGSVEGPLLTQKSPTCAYLSQKLWQWDPGY